MKYLALLTIIFALGCSPLKRIERIYTHNPELRPTSTVDTLVIKKDTIIYKDTIVPIHIPGETVTDSIPFPVYVDKDFVSDTIRVETSFAIAKAWIEQQSVKLWLYQKDSIIYFKLDSVIQIANHWESMYINEVKVIKEPYCPKWKDTMSIVGIVLSVIALLVGVYLVKRR